jgi:CBS domain-containing protein
MIPVIDPNDDGKVIGIITNEAIMNLLTETEKS